MINLWCNIALLENRKRKALLWDHIRYEFIHDLKDVLIFYVRLKSKKPPLLLGSELVKIKFLRKSTWISPWDELEERDKFFFVVDLFSDDNIEKISLRLNMDLA